MRLRTFWLVKGLTSKPVKTMSGSWLGIEAVADVGWVESNSYLDAREQWIDRHELVILPVVEQALALWAPASAYFRL